MQTLCIAENRTLPKLLQTISAIRRVYCLKNIKLSNNCTIVRMVYIVRTFIIFSSYGIIKHQVFKRHNVNKITGAVMLQSKNILLMI